MERGRRPRKRRDPKPRSVVDFVSDLTLRGTPDRKEKTPDWRWPSINPTIKNVRTNVARRKKGVRGDAVLIKHKVHAGTFNLIVGHTGEAWHSLLNVNMRRQGTGPLRRAGGQHRRRTDTHSSGAVGPTICWGRLGPHLRGQGLRGVSWPWTRGNCFVSFVVALQEVGNGVVCDNLSSCLTRCVFHVGPL